jgi:hypothetical protein
MPSLRIPSPRLLPAVLMNQVYLRADRDVVDDIFDDFSNTLPACHAHVRCTQKRTSIPEFHRNLASSHGELLHALSYAAFASTLPQQTDCNALLIQLPGNQGLVSAQKDLGSLPTYGLAATSDAQKVLNISKRSHQEGPSNVKTSELLGLLKKKVARRPHGPRPSLHAIMAGRSTPKKSSALDADNFTSKYSSLAPFTGTAGTSAYSRSQIPELVFC